MNADGALQAFELAQSLTLTQFSVAGGVEDIAKALLTAPPAIVKFLMEVSISVSGFCQLNWGNKFLWHSLVDALLVQIPNGKNSMLDPQMVQAITENRTDSSVYDRIIATPPVAILLFIRWLRTDLVQQEIDAHFVKIINNRPNNTPT